MSGGQSDPSRIWKDGEIVGYRQRYSDHMAMFLLRKQLPDRFGDLHRDRPAPSLSATAPLPLPVADTLARLGPARPADPSVANDPDLLDLSLARLANGRMPPGLESWAHPDERTLDQGLAPEDEALLREQATGRAPPRAIPPADHDDLCRDEDEEPARR